jgi:uncharacterized membrane-anchored protein
MENKAPISKKALFVALALIVIFFGGAIAINEYTLVTGEDVYLETIPVDPRDILRGDFVILDYKISTDKQVQTFINNNQLEAGQEFYIVLSRDETDTARVQSVSFGKPYNELFIKAQVGTEAWRRTQVELGIGKYFVPEGRGREVERLRGDLRVLVSIDSYGTAKIKDIYNKDEKIDFTSEQ